MLLPICTIYPSLLRVRNPFLTPFIVNVRGPALKPLRQVLLPAEGFSPVRKCDLPPPGLASPKNDSHPRFKSLNSPKTISYKGTPAMPKRRPRTQSLTFRLAVILIFVIALILFRMTGEIGPDRVPRDRFRVVRVIDGDTVELVGGDRLRLLAIDSPERGEPFYAAAKDYLAALVLDSTLDITYSERRRDRYGRILAYVWLDTVMVNERMLSAGLANLYIFEDNLGDRDQMARLLAAQNRALDAGAGIWSYPVAEEPFYLSAENSLRFHRPDCPAVARLDPARAVRYRTREEALRLGLAPCRDCRP